MKKNYFKKHLKFIIPIIVLSVGVIALTTWGVTTQTLAITYSKHLENQYEKSFYQAVDGVDKIEADLSKIIVTLDKDALQLMLSEVYMISSRVQSDLASLPLEHNAIDSTLNFVNTLGGYCFAMKNILYNGQELSSEQNAQLEDFYETSKIIKQQLNTLTLKILGDYKIINNININQKDINYFSQEWEQTNQATSSTPALIYDGPFSDAIINKEVKGLSDTEITKETGKEIVNGTIGKVFDINKVEYSNTTEGKFVTYNYTLTTTGNKQYNVQVTKKGGLVLSLDELEPTNAVSDYGKTNAELKVLSQEFCANIGYDTVVPIYLTEMGNYCYINLVPKIDDVYIYPDMLKVKIEKTSGVVCGFDAVSFAYNNQERTNLTATVGVTHAKSMVNSNMEIFSTKLCVIPLEFGGEALVYEFYGSMMGNEYYVYINANTLKQENILRVVSTSEGELTV